MRAVVIQHQMDIEFSRDVGFDGAQERRNSCCDDADAVLRSHAGGDVQRREQSRRAMAQVVMRAPLGHAGGQRQDRLGAIQGLDLALLIHAQHHRLGRRIQIQARRGRAPCRRTADRSRPLKYLM